MYSTCSGGSVLCVRAHPPMGGVWCAKQEWGGYFKLWYHHDYVNVYTHSLQSPRSKIESLLSFLTLLMDQLLLHQLKYLLHQLKYMYLSNMLLWMAQRTLWLTLRSAYAYSTPLSPDCCGYFPSGKMLITNRRLVRGIEGVRLVAILRCSVQIMGKVHV